MIEFKDVSKTYDDGTIAVQQVNFQIEKGEFVSLIGPSGCGKTTTMKMINRLIEPTSGDILIDGKSVFEQSPVELRRSIGYVIQQIGLLPHMTVGENVALVPKLLGWNKAKIKSRTEELMALVGLDPSQYSKKYPLELSGGQQQRIGVIRALAAEPPIILMDEPFSALDPITREKLQDEVKVIQREIQKTIVFVTHDMDEAIKMSDKIAILQEGRLSQLAPPAEILTNPKTDFVKGFIGDRYKQKLTMYDFLSLFTASGSQDELPLHVHKQSSIRETLQEMYKKPSILVAMEDTEGVQKYARSEQLIPALLQALDEGVAAYE